MTAVPSDGGDQVRVSLVGCGRAGLVHGRNFAGGVPGARLVGVCDADAEAAEAAAAELGVPVLPLAPEEAAASDDVDAVVVASPTFTHADIVVPALEAGAFVLCEKPLAASLHDAQRVARAERSSDATLVMGFMRRFDRQFARAAERIAAGDIGTPLLVKSTGRGPGLPPEWAWDIHLSGGLAAEVNSHDFDTVRWLSGQELQSVHAVGRAAKRPDIRERYPDFTDLLVATFELSEGGLATVDGACPADYGYDARAEIYGTEGSLFIGSPLAPAPLMVGPSGAASETVRSWRTLFADAYWAEDEHLVRVASGLEAPAAGVEDGLCALRAVAAVNRSVHEGAPVALADVGVERGEASLNGRPDPPWEAQRSVREEVR